MDEQQLLAMFDLLQDLLGSVALSITLTDSLQGNILHLGSASPHSLTLTIKNKTQQTVTIAGLSGDPSEDNNDFSIKFTNNSFYFISPPTVLSPSNWKAAVYPDRTGYSNQIYLLTTEDVTLQPSGKDGDTITVVLIYTNAIASSDAIAVDSEVIISPGKVSSGGQSISGSIDLQLILLEDEGVPSPLAATIIGSHTVLNDGTSDCDLKLRITNQSTEPVAFETPITSEQETPTLIRVRIQLSNDTSSYWALCTTDEADDIGLNLPDDESDKWRITSSSTATEKVWELKPIYTKNSAFAGNSVLELTLTNVKSALAPGFTDVAVDFRRFPVYGSQTKVVQIEKSPLVYDNRNVGIGTSSPEYKLDVVGGDFCLSYGQAIRAGSSSWPNNKILETGWDSSLSQDYVKLYTTGSGSENSAPKITLLRNGSVGIGTTSPEAKLEVIGGGDTNVDFLVNGRLRSNNNDGGLWVASDRFVGGHDTNKIGFWNGSDWRLTVQNDGNVGIGTTTPKRALHVEGDYYGKGHLYLHAFEGDGNNGTAYVQARDDSNSTTIDLQLRTQQSGSVQDVMRLTSERKVGIGTTSPATTLHIGTGSDSSGGSQNSGYLITGDASGYHLSLDNNEIMAKSNGTTTSDLSLNYDGGAVYIGRNGQLRVYDDHVEIQGDLRVNGWIECPFSSTSYYLVPAWNFFSASGWDAGPPAVTGWDTSKRSWNCNSDSRLKKNIEEIPGALDKLTQLRGVTFQWNETAAMRYVQKVDDKLSAFEAGVSKVPVRLGEQNLAQTEESTFQRSEATLSKEEVEQIYPIDEWRKQAEQEKEQFVEQMTSLKLFGLIADEVENTLPEIVNEDADGYKVVDYIKLIPILIEAVKDLNQKVEDLRNGGR